MHRTFLESRAFISRAARHWAGGLAITAALFGFAPVALADPADGTWYGVPVSIPAPPTTVAPRLGHTIVYDSSHQRFVLFGGRASLTSGERYNDVWVRGVTASAPWTRLEPAGTPPAPRFQHAAVYDSIGDRMLVIGGDSGPYPDDVWELKLGGTPTWSQLAPDGESPGGRAQHSAVFDAPRNRVVVFGGLAPYPINDVWYLNCGSSPPVWEPATTAGNSPSPRSAHVAIFDSNHDQMVVCGGRGNSNWLGDAWTLTFGAGDPVWTRRATTTLPGPREMACAAFDRAGNRMLLLGGRRNTTTFQDLYVLGLDGFAWYQLLGAPTPARCAAAMAVAPNAGRVVMLGGCTTLASLDDCWEQDFLSSVWTQTLPSPLPKRYASGGFYDQVRGRFVMVGGARDEPGGTVALGDVAELVIGRDSTWASLPVSIGARYGHSVVYDLYGDRLLIFGGTDGIPNNSLQHVRFHPTLVSASITGLGTPPSARAYHSAIYDPVRDRMLLFGGNDGQMRNDLWQLDLTDYPAWSPITPLGITPAPRMAAGAVYDPGNDFVLLFGGFDGTHSLNDLWALSLRDEPAWTELTPFGAVPGPRSGHVMILDPSRNRVLVHGGRNADTGVEYDDLWELDLTTLEWHLLLPDGAAPAGRHAELGLFDPANNRMVFTGGNGTAGTRNEVWRLQLPPPPPPPPTATPGPETASAIGFALRGLTPNPARRDRLTVAFTLPQRTRATLDLIDVSGRKRASRVMESPIPGPGTADLTPERPLEPGLYFVRLTQGTRVETRRGAVIR